MTETKPKRRWFRFSIRDLLLVTAIAALAVGWWLDHQKLTKRTTTPNKVYYLKYADAEEVRESLQRRFFNEDVSVIVGPTSDAIFARGAAKQQADIEAHISKLDVPPSKQMTTPPMRLRFSIRDLLWLTALVAWWVDRGRLVHERRADAIRYDTEFQAAVRDADRIRTLLRDQVHRVRIRSVEVPSDTK